MHRCVPTPIAMLLAVTFVVGGADSDGDGVPDAEDNCPIVPNADQADDEQPGTFAERLVATPAAPNVVAAGDVDGDGDPDIVANSLSDDTIWWFDNQVPEGGGWGLHVITGSAQTTLALGLADVNGDDRNDVVAIDLGFGIGWFENPGRSGTGHSTRS